MPRVRLLSALCGLVCWSGLDLLAATEAPQPFLVDIQSPLSFQQPLLDLTAEERRLFNEGRALFNQLWVASPSLNPDLDGLGPTFNQSSCAACHLRNGRGKAPEGPHERLRGMLIRLSVLGPHGPIPHPFYGEQLQESAVLGVPPEGRIAVQWVEVSREIVDGTVVPLRRPQVEFSKLNFSDISDARTSARVAPAIVGSGLLDAVPDALLEALAATPRPDQIRGQINRLPSGLGRFGWKANMSGLREQTAGAFSGDLGITSSLFPLENCPPAQEACESAHVDTTDLSDAQLAATVFYQAALAVPAPRDQEHPLVIEGRALFASAGCQHCHVPELKTGLSALLPTLANRVFHPYTDLLLHDMGEDLADGRPDFEADGRQWRTPPLWGIGLVPMVNEHQQLLHDGRARNVVEAVLWHGGEGLAAAERVAAMTQHQRAALEAFVLSL